MSAEGMNGIHFEKEGVSPTVIKVVGVGGGGCNAVNRMIQSGLNQVDFVAINTDMQALSLSKAKTRIQIGKKTTMGLGSGANPERGRAAAEEDEESIRQALRGADMVFVTAGMGKGTGTGASPIVARVAKELGCLTVAIVTKPFGFEGGKRMTLAERGIAELSQHVDTLIVIANNNLFLLADKKLQIPIAFEMADSILLQGVRGIAEIITKPGIMNVDFADVRTIMAGKGNAILGMATASGDNRGVEVAEKVITNQLIEGNSIDGASGLLVNITHGPDTSLYELDEIVKVLTFKAKQDAEVIVGNVLDPELENEVRITVIATGFDRNTKAKHLPPIHLDPTTDDEEIDVMPTDRPERQIKLLRDEDFIVSEESLVREPYKGDDRRLVASEKEEFDIPAFLRKSPR